MAIFYNQKFSKQDLLKKVGDIEQIARITSIELKEGDSNGVRGFEVDNGTGLSFLVLADRGLDIGIAKLFGIPFTTRFHPGEVSPNFYEDLPFGFIKAWPGGLMTTCGPTSVGSPGEEGPEKLVQHGNHTHIPAKYVQYEGRWEGDDYRLQIRGRIRDVGLFLPNIEIRRKITTYLGVNKILVEDEIENIGFRKTPFMLVYHCNYGFPLVDDGARVNIDSSVTPRDDQAKQGIEEWDRIVSPVRGFKEQVFYHDVKPKKSNLCEIGIVNENFEDNKKLGIIMRYKKDSLPLLTQWRCLSEGEYVVGLEPGNCHVEGRKEEREKFKNLDYLKPGEIRKISLEFEPFCK